MVAANRHILDVACAASHPAPMSAMLPEGTIFAGRYRVIRWIATGGMGAIYEVMHLETERRRALKVMHPHLFQSDDMRERFKREARIAANVESEFIVDVSDAGVDASTGMPYLVMELLRGEELGQRLKRMGRLPPAEALNYLHQTALALDRTHAASIVHRDLKPENLFCTQREDGSVRIKILDFGIAKLVAEGATGAGVTQSLGTPLYMSPEQFHSGMKLTGAADIYALGMMAYTLLVGEAYWGREVKSAGDLIAFVMVAVRGPQESAVQRASTRGVVLPLGFDAWFARATAVHPPTGTFPYRDGGSASAGAGAGRHGWRWLRRGRIGFLAEVRDADTCGVDTPVSRHAGRPCERPWTRVEPALPRARCDVDWRCGVPHTGASERRATHGGSRLAGSGRGRCWRLVDAAASKQKPRGAGGIDGGGSRNDNACCGKRHGCGSEHGGPRDERDGGACTCGDACPAGGHWQRSPVRECRGQRAPEGRLETSSGE